MNLTAIASAGAFAAGLMAASVPWGMYAKHLRQKAVVLEGEKQLANERAEMLTLEAENDARKAQEVADAAAEQVRKFARKPPQVVESVRIVRRPALVGVCQPAPGSPAPDPAEGQDRPSPVVDADPPIEETTIRGIRSADFAEYRSVVERKLAEYRVGYQAHQELSKVVAALPCVEITN